MYAVIEDGSRQHRVSRGDLVILDHREIEQGAQLELNQVLLYANGESVQIGQPMLEGARVLAEVVGFPSKKHVIQKLRRRKNSRRRKGHRQHFIRVMIRHILLAGEEAPAEEEQKLPEEQPSVTSGTSEAPESETSQTAAAVSEQQEALTEEAKTETAETEATEEEKKEEPKAEEETAESTESEEEAKSEDASDEKEKKENQ